MKKLLLSFSVLLVLVSCKKEITELPPPTQTGANTFGAKVNGSFFVPQGFGSLPASDILEVRRLPSKDVIINARNFASSPNEKEFELRIKNVIATGVYPLNTTTTPGTSAASYGYYVKRNVTPENEWITSATYTGSVTITHLDTVNRIVSGTFEFNALNLYNAPEPLSVTEGRFDVKWQ
ncbi:MAG TPA: DUF6252 family protein [Chitinophagaceae bacterium]|jgi:hypothetical protein|nr:DUF6252 family protein [Chitinophagaceae bacterium]